MEKSIYIGTNKQKFMEFINALTDKRVERDRKRKILKTYSKKYKIKKDIVKIAGCKVHLDYLPVIDAMLKANENYSMPQKVVGGALYKIERDCCIFLTDSRDPNLKRVYEANQKKADTEAEKLWKLVTEEFDYQMTHTMAQVLSGSFATVFGQTYGDWRKSLNKFAC